jgi:hypothetical protein
VEHQENKCAHPPCACKAATGDRYCSDSCSDADAAPVKEEHPKCECQHEDCTGEAISLAEAEGLMVASSALSNA